MESAIKARVLRAIFLYFFCFVFAEPGRTLEPRLFVLSPSVTIGPPSILVININNDEVVASIPATNGPSGVAIAPDGSKVYVSTFDGTIIVIDPATNSILSETQVGTMLGGLSFLPDGSELYVVDQGSILVIDPATVAVLRRLDWPYSTPLDIKVHPAGRKAYIFNDRNAGYMFASIVDAPITADFPSLDNVDFGRDIAFTPDGTRTVIVTGVDDGGCCHAGQTTVQYSVLDTVSNERLVHGFVESGGLGGVDTAPDNQTAYMTNPGAKTPTGADIPGILVLDIISGAVTDRFTLPGPTFPGVLTEPGLLKLSPDGRKAYVVGSDGTGYTVTVINLASKQAIKTIPISLTSFPNNMTYKPWSIAVGFVQTGIFPVRIDIKPASAPNSINPRSRGKIPVAILTTESFDAPTVDRTTVLFGATGTETAPVHSALEDVDRDGDTDMILQFNIQDTGIVCGNSAASLTGETLGGQTIKGTDSINTVGCK